MYKYGEDEEDYSKDFEDEIRDQVSENHRTNYQSQGKASTALGTYTASSQKAGKSKMKGQSSYDFLHTSTKNGSMTTSAFNK